MIFFDSYDNRGEGIDEDGVNLPDSTRYSFAASSWSVNVGTGKLVSASDTEAILFFHDGTSRIVNIQVDVTLSTNGDWMEILYGGVIARVEKTVDGMVFSCGGETFTDALCPDSFTFYVSLFSHTRYESEFQCFSPDTTEDFIRFGPSKFITCPWFKTTIGSGYTNIGFKAKTGIELDNLIVTQATRNCDTYENSCSTICSTMPDTITVSIAGAVSGQAWCGPTEAPTECGDDLTTCLQQCDINHTPGTFAHASCQCACYVEYDECYCGYIASNGSCVTDCQCAMVNGTHVMSRDGDCSCNYSTTIPYSTRGLDHTLGCPLVEQEPLTISATLQYEYCDVETGESYVTLFLNMPFASPTVAYWYSGVINADVFCSGGTVSIITEPPGAVQYADEVLLGCALGCGTPSGYGCGSGPIDLEHDSGTLHCNDAIEVLCGYAPHSTVSISDAGVA